MSKVVEYRVRPVVRYIVTRYESSDNATGASTMHGPFDHEEAAYAVGYALCKTEHEASGEPIDSVAFIYPEPPAPQPAR